MKEIFVAALFAGLGLLFVNGLTGCGMSAGGVVIGTTGYLAEVNHGNRQHVEQTYANR